MTDIEDFARLFAARDLAADPDALLALHGLTPDRWDALQREWAKRLMDDAQALRDNELEKFIGAYRRAVEAPSASPLPTASAAAPVGPVPPAAPVSSAVVSPPVVVPAQAPVHYAAPAAMPISTPAHARVAPDPPHEMIDARRTVMHGASLSGGPALPFRPGEGPPQQPNVRVAEPRDTAALASSHQSVRESHSGFTQAPGHAPAEVMPFPRKQKAASAPLQIDLSMMPLERYAELTFALASGEGREAVLRRFVLTEEVWLALAQAWGQKIAATPALRTQFDDVIRRLKARPSR